MSAVSIVDEYSHAPSKHPDWCESYHFNFVDPDHGVSGFSTVSLLPNSAKREFVFALFHDDKREEYVVESEGAVPDDLAGALSDGRLSYELVEPLESWRIRFSSENLSADVSWRARFPAYYFGPVSVTSWRGHFAQSGQVEGIIKLPSGTRAVKGLGQRDRSWGPLDSRIESSYALHAQFDSLSIGLRRDVIDRVAHVSGAISSADGEIAVSKVDLETKFIEDATTMPIRAVTRVHGVDESRYTLHSSLISQTSFARFSRTSLRGSTEFFEEMAIHECEELGKRGTGLMEWLFTHPKK